MPSNTFPIFRAWRKNAKTKRRKLALKRRKMTLKQHKILETTRNAWFFWKRHVFFQTAKIIAVLGNNTFSAHQGGIGIPGYLWICDMYVYINLWLIIACVFTWIYHAIYSASFGGQAIFRSMRRGQWAGGKWPSCNTCSSWRKGDGSIPLNTSNSNIF